MGLPAGLLAVRTLHLQHKTEPCKDQVCHKLRAASALPRGGSKLGYASRDCVILLAMETRCARCQAPMSCNPDGDCWCAKLPRIPMPADASGCCCPDCLQKEISLRSEKTLLGPAPDASG
jgi:hypothetical protein